MVKKILSIILAQSMMLTVLAACGQNKPNVDPGHDDEVSDTLALIVDGASDYVIVRGENAYISEITASTELQSYLKQISGVEIPIVTDSAEPVAKEIVVGKTNREAEGEFNREELGDEGFIIKTSDSKLWLVGGEQRGTLYAVYEFLEEYLGCRFYMSNVEKIPEMKTVSLEKIDEDKQIPAFEFRFSGWVDYCKDASLMAKRRYNFGFKPRNEENIKTYGGDKLWIGGHTFRWMIPYSEYGAEHPEYFAVDENGEYYLPASDAGTDHPQLCLSNPEVINLLIEKVRQYIIDNPNATIFHLSQNDNPNFCKCDNCMRICDEEGGSLAGTLIRALNTVSEAVSEELNGRYLMTYAYMYTRSAPVTAPADNIIIQFCPIDCCSAHPVTENCFNSHYVTMVDGTNNSLTEDFESWAALTDNIMIYEYNMNWPNYNLLVPDFDNMFENFKYYNSKVINGFYWQGMLAGTASTFTELKCYLMSKLMWDPDMTKDEYYSHMDDFLEGVYGPGWESLKNYIFIAQEEYSGKHGNLWDSTYLHHPIEIVENINSKDAYPEEITEDMIRNYENYDWTKYYNWFTDAIAPRVLSEGEKLFEEALAKAETESQKYQIERAKVQINYLKSFYLAVKYRVAIEVKPLEEIYYVNVEDTWNGAVNKILTNFFKANPDMFTKQETIQYRVAITKYVADTIYNGYLQLNKDLFSDFKKFGLRIDESGPDLYDSFDDIALTYTIKYWNLAQDLYGGQ